ncbi:MAG: hypothetical protein E4H20_01840 [Spirochaetales bacterium]|nr:MAG: hypothetical protein E4H20_01840 [Spirochaetales bacterium]
MAAIDHHYLYPFLAAEAFAEFSADDRGALYCLSDERYIPVSWYGHGFSDTNPPDLDKDTILAILDEAEDGRARSFVPAWGESLVSLELMTDREMILVRSPGNEVFQASLAIRLAAMEFRTTRLHGDLPATLSPDNYFSALRADPGSRCALEAGIYELNLEPFVSWCVSVCPHAQRAFFLLDFLRFLQAVAHDTATVRSTEQESAIISHFSPRAADPELLGFQLAASMHRVFAAPANTIPHIESFISIDLRESGSANLLASFLSERR